MRFSRGLLTIHVIGGLQLYSRPDSLTGGIVARLPRPTDGLNLVNCTLNSNHPFSVAVLSGTGNLSVKGSGLLDTGHGISTGGQLAGRSIDSSYSGPVSVASSTIASNRTGVHLNGTTSALFIGNATAFVGYSNTGTAISSSTPRTTIDHVWMTGYVPPARGVIHFFLLGQGLLPFPVFYPACTLTCRVCWARTAAIPC